MTKDQESLVSVIAYYQILIDKLPFISYKRIIYERQRDVANKILQTTFKN
jgi:hypothetical protein